MQCVASREYSYYRDDGIDFLLNKQIPYFRSNGFKLALGYCLFWLGVEYIYTGKTSEALEKFKEVIDLLSPSDVYYANAKSAIYGETKKQRCISELGYKNTDYHASGSTLRFINGKLYFWDQPGFGFDLSSHGEFWNLAACDSLVFDPEMKVGDIFEASDGKGKISMLSDSEKCETPAGTFENCICMEYRGNYYGLTYCKTHICPSIGIVRQEFSRHGQNYTWELSNYKILGGDGIIPFAKGNRWEYLPVGVEEVFKGYEVDAFYEVTDFKDGIVTISDVSFKGVLGYQDTFEGKMKEVIDTHIDRTYYTLIDVREALARAKELAVTKRQKTNIKVAEEVMLRILDSDEKMNPNYREKGRWNFYEKYDVGKNDGKVFFSQIEHFEWKNMQNCSPEGYKVLYSFFDLMVSYCKMGYFSDEWIPGFTKEESKEFKFFKVLDNETVITPAGSFDNCRHISFELAQNDYFGGQSECWYALGIGFVKFVHKSGDNINAVWSLTSYDGIGEGYFPTSDGLFRRYEPENLGEGYHASLEYTFDSDESGTVLFRNAYGTQDRADYEKILQNK